MDKQFQEAIALLETLKEEFDSNKKAKEKLSGVIAILDKNADLAVEKALIELEELNSLNLPSYHRTQVWGVVSLLESMKN